MKIGYRINAHKLKTLLSNKQTKTSHTNLTATAEKGATTQWKTKTVMAYAAMWAAVFSTKTSVNAQPTA